jgi:hypothetical protein
MQIKLPPTQGGMLLSRMPFSINFAVTARLSGSFTLDELQDALRRLGLRHPLLAARVMAGDEGAAYITDQGVPPIPVKVITRTSDHDWVNALEHDVAIPFDYRTGPTFRLIWLKEDEVSDLILICDHLTADGRAGIYALRDLLALLADPTLELDPVAPAIMADLLPSKIVKKLKALIAADPDAGPPTAGGWHDSPVHPKQVIPFTLSESETTTLIRRCRVEGVTVQAALCAAFLTPFAEQDPAIPVRQVEIPVDIRGRLAQPVDESYGMFISLVMLDLDCSPERVLWEIARDAGEGLATAMREEQFFYAPTVIITVTGKLPAGMAFGAGFDLSISNLGQINIPYHYGQLTLESVYAPTFNVSKSDHRVLGVTTFNGCMYCTYTTCDPNAPQLLARSQELLAEMIGMGYYPRMN